MGQIVEYRYERLSKDNIHHLVTLFEQVFHKKITLDFIRQKYNTEYLGKSYLGHIAFKDKRPLAYGGYIPYRIQYRDKIEIGAQSVDSMSLPEIKGKGIFKQIYLLNESLLKEEGIEFGYGFANQDSAPVFVNGFGWTTNAKMAVFLIPIKGIPTSKILSKIGLNKWDDDRLNTIFKDYQEVDSFVNPFSLEENGYVPYTKDLLAYREGNRRYILQIDGFSVWIKIDGKLSVGQIEDCTESQFLTIIEKLIELGRKIGLNELFLQYSPQSIQANMLKTKYTPIEGSPICFKPFAGTHIPLDKILFSNADLDTF